MKLVQIVFILLFTGSLYAEDQNNIASDRNATFINIVSNLKNTTILFDGQEIGTAPIKYFSIQSYSDHNITAVNDDEYHEKNITKHINLPTNNLQTVEFHFKPLQTEIFLVGEDGELYINGKFQKMLHNSNRVMKIDAGKNILFSIHNKEKDTSFKRDLKGDAFTQINYKLKSIPKEIRLYTSYMGNLIWEDTKEAVNQNINFKKAKRYCENLQIAYLKDWRLPTIDELNTLYSKYKDKIYNGYGEPFYWSSNTSIGKSGIWSYAQVKNFTADGEVKRSIQEFDKGKVRCVHDIAYKDKVKEIKIDKEKLQKDLKDMNKTEPGYYDPNLTKNLQKYMLK